MGRTTLCRQCGRPFSEPACGPTHALFATEGARIADPPKIQHYVYAIVDTASQPETPPLLIVNTRKEARIWLKALDAENNAGWRIKRGKLVLYGR